MQPPPAADAKWQVLYPLYVDKSRSAAQGRRVPLAVAVAEPTAAEMALVCKFLKLEHAVEADKRHPADCFNVGRVRVCLRTPAGPCNTEVPSKQALLLRMCELIPTLKTRGQPAGGAAPAAAASKKKQPTTRAPVAKVKKGKGKGK